jgi:hypothetical protein
MLTAFTVRTYSRFPVHCPVSYMGPDFLGTGTVWNLSRSGWRVQGDSLVERGMKLSLSITLPGEKEPVKVDKAVVRWVQGQDFGVKIVEMLPEEWTRLARVVDKFLEHRYGSTAPGN